MRRHAPDVLATAKAQRWEPAEAVRALLAEEARRPPSLLDRASAEPPPGSPPARPSTPGTRHVSSIPATHATVAGRTLEWIDHHENLVVCGPSGTGKIHLLEALGHAAIDHGSHVAVVLPRSLGALVHRHRVDDTTTRAIRKILRPTSSVIDDIGLLPVTTDTAEALYRVVDAAYERRSIALSSNLHPAGFDELMPKTIANATVDRLLHHAHVVITTGDSIRLTQATRGKGVKPLT